MAERYVRPPTVATEARPTWICVLRFRLVALILLSVLVGLAVLVFLELTGATAQDPGLESLGQGARG